MIDPNVLAGLQNYVGAVPPPQMGITPDQLAGLQSYVGGGMPAMPGSDPIPSPVPGFTAGVSSPMPGELVDPGSPGQMSPGMSAASMPPIDAGGGVAPGAVGQLPGAVMGAAAGQAMPLDGSVPAAPAPAAPGGGGGGMGADPMAPARGDVADQMRTGLEEQNKAGTDAAIAQSAFAQEQQKQMEQMAAQQAQAEQQRKAAETKAFDEYTAVKNAAMQPDAQADPGKWWKDQSTFGKVMSALSLVIGTIGEATARAGGGNVQVGGMLNGVMSAIQKNVADQKEAIAAQRAQKKENLAIAGNAYAMARQRGLDDRQAEAAATTMHLNQLKAMSDSIAAKSNVEKVKADATAASALLEGKIVETETKARHDWQQDYLARQQNLIAQGNLSLARRNADRADAQFGLDVAKEARAGQTVDKDTKKLVNEVENSSGNLKNNLSTLRSLVKTHGTQEWTGNAESEMNRAIYNIAVDYAKLTDPGAVVRESDVKAMKELLFRPGDMFTMNSTVDGSLANFEQEIEQRRLQAYKVRGLGAPPDSSPSAVAGRLGATRR